VFKEKTRKTHSSSETSGKLLSTQKKHMKHNISQLGQLPHNILGQNKTNETTT